MVRSAEQNFIGTKHMASARKKSNSSDRLTSNERISSRETSTSLRTPARRKSNVGPKAHFAVCVKNDDYRASLELRKLYVVLEDEFASKHNMIRVIDESGEDYLFPASYFVRVELPQTVEQVLRRIASAA